MGFEVTPEPVDRGRGRAVALTVALAGAAIVLVAVASALASRPGVPATARPVAEAAATPAVAQPTARPSDAAAGLRPAPTLPPTTTCEQLDRPTCAAVIRAALAALPADLPPVVHATAWRSLLCGDPLDCPPSRLAEGRPLAGVTVEFADGGPSGWLNVVAPAPRAGARTPEPVAWLARWMP